MKNSVLMLLASCLCFCIVATLVQADPNEPFMYLSFDDPLDPLANEGTAGYEAPRSVGNQEGNIDPNYVYPDPHASVGIGIRGGCLDARGPVLHEGTDKRYGGWISYGANGGDDANETPLEEALQDLKSFTITGWMWNPEDDPITGYVIKDVGADALDFNFYLYLKPASPGRMRLKVQDIYTDCPGRYGKSREWEFFAVTYDSTFGDGFTDNVHWYKGGDVYPGDPNDPNYPNSVEYIGSSLLPTAPVLDSDGGDRAFGLLNNYWSEGGGIRAYYGLLDEFKMFGSKTDGSGALSEEAINEIWVEAFDAKCGVGDSAYPDGDVNYDCIVDMRDLSLLATGWLDDNRPVIP